MGVETLVKHEMALAEQEEPVKSDSKKSKSDRKERKKDKKEKRLKKEKEKDKKERKKRSGNERPPLHHVLDATALYDDQQRPSKKVKREEDSFAQHRGEPAMDDIAEDTNIGLGEQVKPKVDSNHVDAFGMSQTTVNALKEKDINSLFEIQAATYKLLRMERKDIIGRARTGSGKTLAFVLPIIETLVADNMTRVRSHEKPLVLCLAPTRELAQQVHRDFEWIAAGHRISTTCFTGGTPKYPQKGELRRGVDVLVGTPGRIIDHLDDGALSLAGVQFVVLDEADEMLSMGFQEDVERILSACTTSKMKQTLLFSATIPRWVKGLAQKYMREGATVTVDTVSNEKNRTNASIKHLALACPPTERASTMADVAKIYSGAQGKTIIFTDTKVEANELAEEKMLVNALGAVGVLHGDIPQSQRERTLASYREGRIRVLVATDVAARGLDIKAVDLVLQTHPPSNYETYIHRSGRTGRAGKSGTCVTLYSLKEKFLIGLIEHKAGVKFERGRPPQVGDVVRASAADTAKLMGAVHEDNVRLFREVARKVLTQFGGEEDAAERALAASLACMAGYNSERFKSRSLLSGFEGYRAAVLTSDREFGHAGQAFGAVKRALGEEWGMKMRGTAVCKDRRKAVFDVPDELAEEVCRRGAQLGRGCGIEVVEEMPELEEEKFDVRDAMNRVYERKQMQRRKWGGGGGGGGGGRGWSGGGGGGRGSHGGGNGGYRSSYGGGGRSSRRGWGG
ncbi:DEAD (Asp-Glu-Ala-Asp) box polypeptide 21 [Gracilaria domingensis]|nr:DEAD (Asp-Glu-Ala-Asp) box polypeptide 21 [Gracilaria domingensis]